MKPFFHRLLSRASILLAGIPSPSAAAPVPVTGTMAAGQRQRPLGTPTASMDHTALPVRRSRRPPGRFFRSGMKHLLILIAAALCLRTGTLMAQTGQIDVKGMLAAGQATVTNTTPDIGAIGNLFDGNTSTGVRTQSINPMIVTLSFTTAPQPSGSRLWFGNGIHRWRIETLKLRIRSLTSTPGMEPIVWGMIGLGAAAATRHGMSVILARPSPAARCDSLSSDSLSSDSPETTT